MSRIERDELLKALTEYTERESKGEEWKRKVLERISGVSSFDKLAAIKREYMDDFCSSVEAESRGEDPANSIAIELVHERMREVLPRILPRISNLQKLLKILEKGPLDFSTKRRVKARIAEVLADIEPDTATIGRVVGACASISDLATWLRVEKKLEKLLPDIVDVRILERMQYLLPASPTVRRVEDRMAKLYADGVSDASRFSELVEALINTSCSPHEKRVESLIREMIKSESDLKALTRMAQYVSGMRPSDFRFKDVIVGEVKMRLGRLLARRIGKLLRTVLPTMKNFREVRDLEERIPSNILPLERVRFLVTLRRLELFPKEVERARSLSILLDMQGCHKTDHETQLVNARLDEEFSEAVAEMSDLGTILKEWYKDPWWEHDARRYLEARIRELIESVSLENISEHPWFLDILRGKISLLREFNDYEFIVVFRKKVNEMLSQIS